MSAAPRGRAGLWQALATAVDDTDAVVPGEALDQTNQCTERPHLGYLARVRGGMAGHPAAGHPSPLHPSFQPPEPADDGPLFGDDVVDLEAYRARRSARLGA